MLAAAQLLILLHLEGHGREGHQAPLPEAQLEIVSRAQAVAFDRADMPNSHPDKLRLADNQTKEEADAHFVELTKAYKS